MRTLLLWLLTVSAVPVEADDGGLVPVRQISPAGRAGPLAGEVIRWQRLDFGAISFRIPPGMTNFPLRGIDSLVGRCESATISLTFDFGRHSSSALREATTQMEIDGRPARVLERSLGPGDYAREGSRGMTNYFLLALPDGKDVLRMSIFCRDPQDLPMVRAIADSVRLRGKPADAGNRR